MDLKKCEVVLVTINLNTDVADVSVLGTIHVGVKKLTLSHIKLNEGIIVETISTHQNVKPEYESAETMVLAIIKRSSIRSMEFYELNKEKYNDSYWKGYFMQETINTRDTLKHYTFTND